MFFLQIASGENQKEFQAAAATVQYKVDHGGERTHLFPALFLCYDAIYDRGT